MEHLTQKTRLQTAVTLSKDDIQQVGNKILTDEV